MGFGGINPCPQSHGKKKFYEVDQSPLKLFKSGNYTKVPLMAGACANDGTLVLSTAYSQNLVPLGLDTDEHFLKYGIIEYMTDIVDMDAAFAFTHDIQKDYFKDNEMGNFDLMTRGLTDVNSKFIKKGLIFHDFFLVRWHAFTESSRVSHGRGQLTICQFLRLLIGKRRAKS